MNSLVLLQRWDKLTAPTVRRKSQTSRLAHFVHTVHQIKSHNPMTATETERELFYKTNRRHMYSFERLTRAKRVDSLYTSTRPVKAPTDVKNIVILHKIQKTGDVKKNNSKLIYNKQKTSFFFVHQQNIFSEYTEWQAITYIPSPGLMHPA